MVLGAQRVPHPDHVVADAQRQAAGADGREAEGVDEAAEGGQRPAAVQRRQIPAFNLRVKTKNNNNNSGLPRNGPVRFRTGDERTHLSVHGGADEELPTVLQLHGAQVEDDPAVALTVRRRPKQRPL